MFYSITSSAALFSSVENFPHCIMSPAVLISTVEKNPLNVEKSPVQSAFIRNFSNDIQSLLEFFRILISWCWKIFDTKIMMSKIFCRKFYCRKFSASPCRKLSITNRLICRKFSVEKSKFSRVMRYHFAVGSELWGFSPTALKDEEKVYIEKVLS